MFPRSRWKTERWRVSLTKFIHRVLEGSSRVGATDVEGREELLLLAVERAHLVPRDRVENRETRLAAKGAWWGGMIGDDSKKGKREKNECGGIDTQVCEQTAICWVANCREQWLPLRTHKRAGLGRFPRA